MNKNFSEKLNKLSTSATNVKPKDESIKLTIELPSDKIAVVANELYNELLDDETITILDKELYDKSIVITIKGDIENNQLKKIASEICDGNDINKTDYKVDVE